MTKSIINPTKAGAVGTLIVAVVVLFAVYLSGQSWLAIPNIMAWRWIYVVFVAFVSFVSGILMSWRLLTQATSLSPLDPSDETLIEISVVMSHLDAGQFTAAKRYANRASIQQWIAEMEALNLTEPDED